MLLWKVLSYILNKTVSLLSWNGWSTVQRQLTKPCDVVSKGAIWPGNDGNRATHLAYTRKPFPLFSFRFIFDGPKIVRAIYVHVIRERCTNDVVYLSARKDYTGLCVLESFLRPTNSSSFDFYASLAFISFASGQFILAHEVTPARVASILMFVPPWWVGIVECFKIWF